LINGWPCADPRKVLFAGVGSCFPPGDFEAEQVRLAGELARRSFASPIIRTEIRGFPSAACPASFLLRDASAAKDLRLANLMPGGGHYPDFAPLDVTAWRSLERPVSDELRALGFRFVAHTVAEWNLARDLGWPPSDTLCFDRVEDYLAVYSRASHYVGNRMHGAVVTVGGGGRALAIGYDSRLDMVRRAGGGAIRPSDLDLASVRAFAALSPSGPPAFLAVDRSFVRSQLSTFAKQ
jgi:hypothetical protein